MFLLTQIIEENNWRQINDDAALTQLCQKVLNDNPKLVTLYKSGKTKVLRAMVGEAFKQSEGLANMGKVGPILQDLLKK